MALLTPSNLKTVRLDLKGIDEYLEAIRKAGGNIEEAVKEAITESAKPIYEDIKKWAESHELSGDTLKGINLSDVQQDGDRIWVDVGVDGSKSKNAWHAVFVEFGTPTQPADPGIRNAFDNNKRRIKKIQKQILAQGGVPVE